MKSTLTGVGHYEQSVDPNGTELVQILLCNFKDKCDRNDAQLIFVLNTQ